MLLPVCHFSHEACINLGNAANRLPSTSVNVSKCVLRSRVLRYMASCSMNRLLSLIPENGKKLTETTPE